MLQFSEICIITFYLQYRLGTYSAVEMLCQIIVLQIIVLQLTYVNSLQMAKRWTYA